LQEKKKVAAKLQADAKATAAKKAEEEKLAKDAVVEKASANKAAEEEKLAAKAEEEAVAKKKKEEVAVYMQILALAEEAVAQLQDDVNLLSEHLEIQASVQAQETAEKEAASRLEETERASAATDKKTAQEAARKKVAENDFAAGEKKMKEKEEEKGTATTAAALDCFDDQEADEARKERTSMEKKKGKRVRLGTQRNIDAKLSSGIKGILLSPLPTPLFYVFSMQSHSKRSK
jgi:hypothetical protein